MNFSDRIRHVFGSAPVKASGLATVDAGTGEPFEDVSSAELDALANQLAREGAITVSLVSGNVESLRIDGPCPRCEHPFSQTRGLTVPASSIRGRRDAAPRVTWAEFVCECRVAHPGTPQGARGCGASYAIGRPKAQGG